MKPKRRKIKSQSKWMENDTINRNRHKKVIYFNKLSSDLEMKNKLKRNNE